MSSGYSKMSKSIANSPPLPKEQSPPSPSSSSSSSAGERQQLEQSLQPQLRRNSSVSSAAKNRALSFSTMRRSSSVSERYCRIHDQSDFLPDHHHHHHRCHDHVDGDGDGTASSDRDSSRSDRKKKPITRSRIIRACKKMLGL